MYVRMFNKPHIDPPGKMIRRDSWVKKVEKFHSMLDSFIHGKRVEHVKTPKYITKLQATTKGELQAKLRKKILKSSQDDKEICIESNCHVGYEHYSTNLRTK